MASPDRRGGDSPSASALQPPPKRQRTDEDNSPSVPDWRQRALGGDRTSGKHASSAGSRAAGNGLMNPASRSFVDSDEAWAKRSSSSSSYIPNELRYWTPSTAPVAPPIQRPTQASAPSPPAPVRRLPSLAQQRPEVPVDPPRTASSSRLPVQSDRDGQSTSGSSRATAAAPTPTSSNLSFGRPPVISQKDHPRNSAILLTARMTTLKTLWATFCLAYDPLIQASDTKLQEGGRKLAYEDSKAQEQAVFVKATKFSYRSSIITAVTSIRKRDVGLIREASQRMGASLEDDVDTEQTVDELITELRSICTEIGLTSSVDAKRAAREERIKSKLSVARLQNNHFLCPPERLDSVGYDVVPEGKTIDEAWGVGGSQPDAAGEQKECDRCQKDFIVGGELGEDGKRKGQAEEACVYHWGKKRWDRDTGVGQRARIQKWTCCGRSTDLQTAAPTLSQLAGYGGPSVQIEGEDGCAKGPHVFKENDVAMLHRREAFKTTAELAEELKSSPSMGEADHTSGPLDIVALDCELSFTTAGMSLTRVSVLNEAGDLVFDEIVRPRAAVLDDNLRFSGIKRAEIEAPGVRSLPEVRLSLARLIGPSTIMVGHGLENDLRALRILHTAIVDTALLFPHPRGLPYRQGLQSLASNHLQRSIQNGPATQGHSSVEDALASLDLIKWKLTNDPRSPFSPLPAPSGAASKRRLSGDGSSIVTPAAGTTAGGSPPLQQSPTMAGPSPPRRQSASAPSAPSLFIPKRR